jgi:hypothetical protein
MKGLPEIVVQVVVVWAGLGCRGLEFGLESGSLLKMYRILSDKHLAYDHH